MMSYTDEWSEAAGEWKKGSEDERLNEETQNSRQRVNWKQRSITPIAKSTKKTEQTGPGEGRSERNWSIGTLASPMSQTLHRTAA